MIEIDIRKSKVIPFVIEPENVGKGWSYSFVYSLVDLRNIYMLCYHHDGFASVAVCLDACVNKGIVSESGKKWDKRNLLEVINALINFNLLRPKTLKPVDKELFFESDVGAPLTENDKRIFEEQYFHYKRFAEFWKVLDESNEKGIVLTFNNADRFADSFILGWDANPDICRIAPNHADTMRFWIVFCSWGDKLGILEKIPSSFFKIETIPSTVGLSLVYKKSSMPSSFSILDYLKSIHIGRTIFIPDLFLSLIRDYRFPIKDLRDKLLNEVYDHLDEYRLQSSSLINIDKNDAKYLPMVDNVYMSHLLKF